MPQFFTQNISTSLIPELSKYYKVKDYKMCMKRIKQIVLLSLFIGLTSTIIITIFPSFFLNLLFKTNEGIDYIRLLSPFTLLFYIEYPLIDSLQALGKSKRCFNITIKNITDIEDCKYTCTITVVDDKDYTKTLEYNFGGTDGEKIENGTISLDIPSNKRFCISFNTYEYEYEEVCDPVAEVLVDGRAMIPDCYIDDYNKDEYEQYEDTINFYGVDCTNTYTFAVAK